MDTILRFLSHSKNIGVLLTLLASLGCGNGTPVQATSDPATTACQPGVAQILVGDGFLKPTCGCIGTNESDRVYLFAGRTCRYQYAHFNLPVIKQLTQMIAAQTRLNADKPYLRVSALKYGTLHFRSFFASLMISPVAAICPISSWPQASLPFTGPMK